MARGRMLNQTVCASLKFQHLSDDTCRLLATWMIAHLDKNGVFYADPAMVKAAVFPRRADITPGQVGTYLDDIEGVGLIYRFRARGDLWQCWPGFADNQVGLRRDRESTTYPDPPGIDAAQPPEPSNKMPEGCRKDAGNNPAEEKGSKENSTKDHGASAPAADAAPPVPSTFSGWQDAIRESTNRQATLRWMIETLYPGLSPPDYPYIGKVARKVGGAGRLADLLWQHSTRPPTGDLLAYIQGVAKHAPRNRRNGNGPAGLSEESKAIAAALSAPGPGDSGDAEP